MTDQPPTAPHVLAGPSDERTTGRRARSLGVAVLAAVTLTVGALVAIALLSREDLASASPSTAAGAGPDAVPGAGPGAGAAPGAGPGAPSGAGGPPATASAPSGVLPADPRGQFAPDFTLARLDGRGPLTLSQLRGRVVVVNYWAAWCTTCRTEAAVLADGYRNWQGRGVAFLGIDVQDQDGDAREFEREFALTYPSVSDPTGAVMRRFGVTGLPETFVLDARGRIAAKWVGAIDAASLDSLLNSATVS
jgi:cytochrome c biogenesis protein CcmG/thiol:disulfide interchange protein DsbE